MSRSAPSMAGDLASLAFDSWSFCLAQRTTVGFKILDYQPLNRLMRHNRAPCPRCEI